MADHKPSALEDPGSNPVLENFYTTMLYCSEKNGIEKEAGKNDTLNDKLERLSPGAEFPAVHLAYVV